MNKEEFLKYMESWYDGMKKELSSDNIKKMIKDHFNCINMTQKRIYDSIFSIVLVLDFYHTKNFFEWLGIDFEEWWNERKEIERPIGK